MTMLLAVERKFRIILIIILFNTVLEDIWPGDAIYFLISIFSISTSELEQIHLEISDILVLYRSSLDICE